MRSSTEPNRKSAFGKIQGAYLFVLASSLLLAAPAAHAEEPTGLKPTGTADEAKAAAQVLFEKASKLARAGFWDDALLVYTRSAALYPHPFTTFSMGLCEQALSHETRARKLFKAALAANPERGPSLDEADKKDAERILSALDGRVGRLRVTIHPADARLQVDGRPIEEDNPEHRPDGAPPVLVAGTAKPGPGRPVRAENFELVLDPGVHLMVLSAPGYEDLVFQETVESGVTRNLPIRLATGAQRRAGYILGVTGLASLAVGTAFGIRAIAYHEQADEQCRGTLCTAQGLDAFRESETSAKLANVALGVGLGTVVLGAVLVITANPSTGDPRATAPRTSVGVALGGTRDASVTLRRAF